MRTMSVRWCFSLLTLEQNFKYKGGAFGFFSMHLSGL